MRNAAGPFHLPARLPLASAAAVASAAPATAVESPFGLRAGLVHYERASIHLLFMELGDGLLRVIVGRHFDERESAGAAGRHVPHYPDVVHLARTAEQLGELFFRR